MPLTIPLLKTAAVEFIRGLSGTAISDLYGVTDGKAIGTYVEARFHLYLTERFDHTPGSAARGIDFPALGVDLKVTSIRQPQSSSPFRSAAQKVYGLGYDLLVIVYDKHDDPVARSARLDIMNTLYIEDEHTADYQMTVALRELLARAANIEEIDAYLEDRNLPIDAEGRRALAERIAVETPELGGLTISNALQWRLQYSRAIGFASSRTVAGISDLIAD